MTVVVMGVPAVMVVVPVRVLVGVVVLVVRVGHGDSIYVIAQMGKQLG